MIEYLKERRKQAERAENHIKKEIKDMVNNDNFMIFKEFQQLQDVFTVIIVINEMLEEIEKKGAS